MSSPSANITSVLKETRVFPAVGGIRRQRAHQEPGRIRNALQRAARTIPKASGPSKPNRFPGSRSGTRCSNGTSRSRNGSSAARPTPPTTASTAISDGPRSEQGRHHLGKASRAIRAC